MAGDGTETFGLKSIQRKGSETGNNPESKYNQYDTHGAMFLKDNTLLKDDFLQKIKDFFQKGEGKSIDIGGISFTTVEYGYGKRVQGNGVEITYEPQYGYIRINNGGSPLNVDINKGEIYIFDAKNPTEKSIQLLEALKRLGVLQENIPYISGEKLQKSKENNQFINNFLEKNNRSDLPFESSDKLNPKTTIPVLQQEAMVINTPKEGDALYTFGAGPCSIITIYDKSTGKIGLAHIDATVKEEKIVSLLSYFDSPDIKIISGDTSTITKVLSGIKTAKMENNVSFMNADLDGSRSDAAGITIKNGKPEIVYGLNSDIKLTPSQEQQLKLIGLDQGGSGLKLNIK